MNDHAIFTEEECVSIMEEELGITNSNTSDILKWPNKNKSHLHELYFHLLHKLCPHSAGSLGLLGDLPILDATCTKQHKFPTLGIPRLFVLFETEFRHLLPSYDVCMGDILRPKKSRTLVIIGNLLNAILFDKDCRNDKDSGHKVIEELRTKISQFRNVLNSERAIDTRNTKITSQYDDRLDDIAKVLNEGRNLISTVYMKEYLDLQEAFNDMSDQIKHCNEEGMAFAAQVEEELHRQEVTESQILDPNIHSRIKEISADVDDAMETNTDLNQFKQSLNRMDEVFTNSEKQNEAVSALFVATLDLAKSNEAHYTGTLNNKKHSDKLEAGIEEDRKQMSSLKEMECDMDKEHTLFNSKQIKADAQKEDELKTEKNREEKLMKQIDEMGQTHQTWLKKKGERESLQEKENIANVLEENCKNFIEDIDIYDQSIRAPAVACQEAFFRIKDCKEQLFKVERVDLERTEKLLQSTVNGVYKNMLKPHAGKKHFDSGPIEKVVNFVQFLALTVTSIKKEFFLGRIDTEKMIQIIESIKAELQSLPEDECKLIIGRIFSEILVAKLHELEGIKTDKLGRCVEYTTHIIRPITSRNIDDTSADQRNILAKIDELEEYYGSLPGISDVTFTLKQDVEICCSLSFISLISDVFDRLLLHGKELLPSNNVFCEYILRVYNTQMKKKNDLVRQEDVERKEAMRITAERQRKEKEIEEQRIKEEELKRMEEEKIIGERLQKEHEERQIKEAEELRIEEERLQKESDIKEAEDLRIEEEKLQKESDIKEAEDLRIEEERLQKESEERIKEAAQARIDVERMQKEVDELQKEEHTGDEDPQNEEGRRTEEMEKDTTSKKQKLKRRTYTISKLKDEAVRLREQICEVSAGGGIENILEESGIDEEVRQIEECKKEFPNKENVPFADVDNDEEMTTSQKRKLKRRTYALPESKCRRMTVADKEDAAHVKTVNNKTYTKNNTYIVKDDGVTPIKSMAPARDSEISWDTPLNYSSQTPKLYNALLKRESLSGESSPQTPAIRNSTRRSSLIFSPQLLMSAKRPSIILPIQCTPKQKALLNKLNDAKNYTLSLWKSRRRSSAATKKERAVFQTPVIHRMDKTICSSTSLWEDDSMLQFSFAYNSMCEDSSEYTPTVVAEKSLSFVLPDISGMSPVMLNSAFSPQTVVPADPQETPDVFPTLDYSTDPPQANDVPREDPPISSDKTFAVQAPISSDMPPVDLPISSDMPPVDPPQTSGTLPVESPPTSDMSFSDLPQSSDVPSVKDISPISSDIPSVDPPQTVDMSPVDPPQTVDMSSVDRPQTVDMSPVDRPQTVDMPSVDTPQSSDASPPLDDCTGSAETRKRSDEMNTSVYIIEGPHRTDRTFRSSHEIDCIYLARILDTNKSKRKSKKTKK